MNMTDAQIDKAAAELTAELVPLVRWLIGTIADDYRASYVESGDPDSDVPSMDVTIGITPEDDATFSWSYQTGDNSFTGGAYGHPYWGVGYLDRDSDPETVARELVDDAVSQYMDCRE